MLQQIKQTYANLYCFDANFIVLRSVHVMSGLAALFVTVKCSYHHNERKQLGNTANQQK